MNGYEVEYEDGTTEKIYPADVLELDDGTKKSILDLETGDNIINIIRKI